MNETGNKFSYLIQTSLILVMSLVTGLMTIKLLGKNVAGVLRFIYSCKYKIVIK